MCKLVEDYANMRAAEEAEKAVEETAKETARRAFAMGLPIESVAHLVKLSTKELEKIAAEVHIDDRCKMKIVSFERKILMALLLLAGLFFLQKLADIIRQKR